MVKMRHIYTVLLTLVLFGCLPQPATLTDPGHPPAVTPSHLPGPTFTELPTGSAPATLFPGATQPVEASSTPISDGWETVHYDPQSWAPVEKEFGLKDCRVVGIVPVGQNDIWFGCWEGAVAHFDNRNADYYPIPKDPAYDDSQVTDISVDQHGVVWLATSEQWLYRFDGKDWTHFTDKDGLTNDWVKTILAAPDGTVWAATEKNLLRYDGKTWRVYTQEDSSYLFDFNRIYDMVVSPEGVLWLATKSGLLRYDGSKWEHFRTPFPGENPAIYRLALAPDGSLWLTNNGGLAHFVPGQYSEIIQVPRLDSQGIGAIYVTREGAVWTGPNMFESRKNMIFCWDHTRWTVYDQFPYKGVNFSLSEMGSFPDGSVWFRTASWLLQFKAKGCSGQ